MRKIIFLTFVLTAFFIACSENSDDGVKSTTSDSMIESGRFFAQVHNECLDNIYGNLQSNLPTKVNNTESSIQKEQVIIDAANQYVVMHSPTTRSMCNDTSINTKMFEGKNVSMEGLKAEIGSREYQYINHFLSGSKDAGSVMTSVSTDDHLSSAKKQAVICFITTYQASSEYWEKNGTKWIELNRKKTRKKKNNNNKINWKEVVFADAYWGYMGMLSSGLNVWVGGGAAAAGSAFSCLK